LLKYRIISKTILAAKIISLPNYGAILEAKVVIHCLYPTTHQIKAIRLSRLLRILCLRKSPRSENKIIHSLRVNQQSNIFIIYKTLIIHNLFTLRFWWWWIFARFKIGTKSPLHRHRHKSTNCASRSSHIYEQLRSYFLGNERPSFLLTLEDRHF